MRRARARVYMCVFVYEIGNYYIRFGFIYIKKTYEI